jgi:single-strand DNA-binding protein
MKVTGKVHFVGALRTVSEKFKSKDVVLLTDEKFPQYITIQFTQDKTELISQNNIGEQVEVSINLRGREWKSPTGEIKYFNTIEGWQINAAQTFSAEKFAAKEADKMFRKDIIQELEDENDLPF